MFVLVGSEAAKIRGVDLGRKPGDTDILRSQENFGHLVMTLRQTNKLLELAATQAGQAAAFQRPDQSIWIIDAEFIDGDNPSSLPVFEFACNKSTGTAFIGPYTAWVPRMDFLYMLKMSHRFKKNSPHFLKTMRDIQKFRAAGADYSKDPELVRLFEVRKDATLHYEHPNLNRTKDEFFVTDNGVDYKYDHDSVHVAMAHLDAPMYTFYAKDGSEVLSDRAKFDALPFEQRLMGVAEEAYVLALERSVVPFRADPKVAFDKALMKVCTSITSGWFREFAWENYDAVQAIYRPNYVDIFWKCVADGTVIQFPDPDDYLDSYYDD